MSLTYAIVLYLICLLLIVAEFFVPSGGLIAAGAVLCGTASIVVGFLHSVRLGVSMIVALVLTVPAVFALLVRVWPLTRIGQQILNRRPGELAKPSRQRVTPRGTSLAELVGRVGIAKTDLLPAGLVIVDGEKLDAITTGMAIDAGSPVIVTSLQGNRIHVRLAEPDEIVEESSDSSRLDSLDIESLE